MDIVGIELNASGYYSGAEYSEILLLPKVAYGLIEEGVKELSFTVPGLDGKHSECDAFIEIVKYSEGCNIASRLEQDYESGRDYLKESIGDLLKQQGLDFEFEVGKVNSYLEGVKALLGRDSKFCFIELDGEWYFVPYPVSVEYELSKNFDLISEFRVGSPTQYLFDLLINK